MMEGSGSLEQQLEAIKVIILQEFWFLYLQILID